jgi:serine phosphatase RsbU (regulator of sigma subunit)
MNPLGEEWGEENVIAALEDAVDKTASAFVNNVMQAALNFTGTAAQHDDMTIVVIRPRITA